MNHTHINTTAGRKARHLQQIVTPARTGGKIGLNHRKQRSTLTAAMLAIAGISAVLGLIAATLIH
jgi:hypothetical protein